MEEGRGLSSKRSSVGLRGFATATVVHTFKPKAYDAGEVAPWTFGITVR